MYPCSKWHVCQVWNQVSNQRLHNRWIDSCARVEYVLIPRLCKRQIDNRTIVDSTVAQASIQRLYKRRFDSCNCRIDGYIDYCQKSIMIFRCPFSKCLCHGRCLCQPIISLNSRQQVSVKENRIKVLLKESRIPTIVNDTMLLQFNWFSTIDQVFSC